MKNTYSIANIFNAVSPVKVLFVLFISLSHLVTSQNYLEPKIENLSWIAGAWYGKAFGGHIEEIWSEPSAGSMMATFKLSVDNEVQFYEIEIIREIENNLVLQLKHFNKDLKGWETKDETVDFPLKYLTSTKAVFEGMTFERISENQMTVYVDIKDDNGQVNTMAFNYRKHTKPNRVPVEVSKSHTPIIIDGKAQEPIWQKIPWLAIDQLWLGKPFTSSDFSGRYKLTWTDEALYLLAEINDDVLLDRFSDPLTRWWDEDCLEIFIDEDNSGGNHQYNHSAFAYHLDLDGNVVDMATDKTGQLYNDHVESKRITNGNRSLWELKILIFDDSFSDDSGGTPVSLSLNKVIGFALAYCDNDTSDKRENFIGSSNNEGFKQDQGWKNSDVFDTIILKD